MWLDLCCVGVELEAKALLDKRLREIGPIDVGEYEVVSIVVTHCAVEFTGYLNLLEIAQLLCKSVRKIGELLAKSGRRCGLTVRMCQHGMSGPSFTVIDESVEYFSKCWHNNLT